MKLLMEMAGCERRIELRIILIIYSNSQTFIAQDQDQPYVDDDEEVEDRDDNDNNNNEDVWPGTCRK